MNTNLNFKQIKRQAARGFTLIELVVVVAIVGILIALVAPNVAGSRDGSTATLLSRTSQVMASNWNIISQSCGTTTDVATSPIPGTAGAANVLKLLMGGSNASSNGIVPATAYANCYAQSKVLPLAEMAQYDGAWKVGGYAVAVSGGGSSPLSVIYSDVPSGIVSLVATKFNAGNVMATTAGSISGVLTWSAEVGGTRTLTFLRQVS